MPRLIKIKSLRVITVTILLSYCVSHNCIGAIEEYTAEYPALVADLTVKSTSGLSTTESGGTGKFSVILDPKPDSIVEVSNVDNVDPVHPMWKALPLRSVAQESVGLPGGEGMQMVQNLQYAPSNPNIVYFVVDTSGVWKSIDGGYSWESKRNGFRPLGGISIGIDPRNENVVFVSGALPRGGSPVDGIYRTLDGGESWKLVKQTYYEKGVTDRKDPGEGQHYAFDHNSFDDIRHQTVYAGTHQEGLLKSTDGGNTWSTIGLTGRKILDVELISDEKGANILYVATNDMGVNSKGLYKVVDNGNDSLAITPLGNLPDYPRTIAIDVQSDPDNVIIYAVVGNYKVYKSVDGGNAFVSKSKKLILDGEYKAISISLADPDFLYVKVGRTGLKPLNPFYSHDGGETWHSPKSLNREKLDLQWIGPGPGIPVAFHPKDPNIAIGCMQSSIRKTIDGGNTWEYSGNGFMGGRLAHKTSFCFDSNKPERMIFFLVDFGPIITEDGGDSWRRFRPGGKTTAVGAVDHNNQEIIVTAVGSWRSHTITRSANGGKTWKKVKGTKDNYVFMKFHPQDSNYIYAGTRNGSWISEDNGKSWTYIPGKSIRCVYHKNGDIVYAIEESPGSNSILWRSKNRGLTWERPIGNKPNPFQKVKDMDIDYNDPNRLYVAARRGVYVFNGTFWSETGKSGGIPTETYGNTITFQSSSIAVDPTSPNVIYVGMRVGNLGHRESFIFRSKDYGQTWKKIQYNLDGYSSVFSLAVHPISGDLYLCTAHGNYFISPGIKN